ncbi:MAG: DUF4886 domain-containing protein [Ruminococcaceae bacterium]|nr:DUF4886 domain-containing protein [Oscillospiraceae bacterium]
MIIQEELKMNVLAIGNSFSNDAIRYLHQITRAGGQKLSVVGLYYGGCTLDRHYRYMLAEEKGYELVYNGHSTGFFISLKQALLSREWDVITVQQASGRSFDPDSYYPYINALVDYARQCAPKAKIVVHQTWAYEQGSAKLEKVGYADHKDMFADIQKAYELAAEKIGADGIIPSGQLFQNMLAGGFEKIHRDTFHATLGAGRYALGLLWYRMITGTDVTDNLFCDFDEEVTQEEISTIKRLVQEFEPLTLN